MIPCFRRPCALRASADLEHPQFLGRQGRLLVGETDGATTFHHGRPRPTEGLSGGARSSGQRSRWLLCRWPWRTLVRCLVDVRQRAPVSAIALVLSSEDL